MRYLKIPLLKEYGQTNILSSPRIAVLNNEEAYIFVGTNQPYATRSISQSSGDSATAEKTELVIFLTLFSNLLHYLLLKLF